MTPDEIDKLTIAEVRAIAERASEALKTLRELGLATPPHMLRAEVGRPLSVPHVFPVAAPFPCAHCGRVAPERPGDMLQAAECPTCGNHYSGVAPLTSKGPVVWSAEEMARRRALPAFDANGEPVAE